MTLGRTSDNKIKIKTDGGLRAVECACCGGSCVGCTYGPHPDLKVILQNWTSVSVEFTWSGFMGFPQKSGIFSVVNGSTEYNYNAGNGQFFFGTISATANDICFSMGDSFFGGSIIISCTGGEFIAINNQLYPASYTNFLPQPAPSISLFFS